MFMILPSFAVRAQQPADQEVNYQLAVIIGGDTMPRYYLREVTVMKRVSLTEEEIKKNKKLIRNSK